MRESMEQRVQKKSIPFHMREMAMKAHLILAYLSFPLLEGVAKKTCSVYVDYDGTVRRPFSVPNVSGKPRQYVTGDRCSSLRDLMHLLHVQVAPPCLAAALDDYCRHIRGLNPAVEPFDLLYTWRNSSLHGHGSYPTIGGTVFNIAILILLDHVADSYGTLRDDVWKRVQWELQAPGQPDYRSPWSYYPPF